MKPGEFLSAEWRYLVMLNYEVPPGVLRPLVPAGTALDLCEGRALVSVVGFRFLNTRLFDLPVPLHRNFDEVNLRFYVRRELPGGEIRRGVVFVRELVPRAAVALVAKWTYNEPYRALPMRNTAPCGITQTPGRVKYSWRTAGKWEHAAATPIGDPVLPAANSAMAFVTDHFWGYTRQRDGSTIEYQVIHPPWRVWGAEAPELVTHSDTLPGTEFAESLRAPPASTFVAEGSPVIVYRPRRLA